MVKSDSYDVVVLGVGYVGLITAVNAARWGRAPVIDAGGKPLPLRITCVDKDEARVKQLQQGEAPFFEAGLPEALALVCRHHLFFATLEALPHLLREARLVVVAVGTPSLASGHADLSSLVDVFTRLGQDVQPGCIVVQKSTVPPGTGRVLREKLPKGVLYVAAPEFLREGTALADAYAPDRVVLGCDDGGPTAVLDVQGVLGGYDKQGGGTLQLCTSVVEAEAAKYVANAMLAARVTWANATATWCEALGADAAVVLRAVAADARVGPAMLRPGPGWGGSCFPKDVRALEALCGLTPLGRLAAGLTEANAEALLWPLAHVLAAAPQRVCVWGLGFKSGTDDVREAPACYLVPELLDAGYAVTVFDELALGPWEAWCARADVRGAQACGGALLAAQGAQVLVVLSDSPALQRVSLPALREALAPGASVVDARRLHEPADWAAAGLRAVVRGVPCRRM